MMPFTLETLPGKEVLSDTLVPSSIWKLICIVLILVNFKNLPLIWHVSTPTPDRPSRYLMSEK